MLKVLKQYLDGQGYNAKVVYNAERNMYRVIASSYDDRAEATQAKKRNLRQNILTVTISKRHGYYIEYINDFFLVN